MFFPVAQTLLFTLSLEALTLSLEASVSPSKIAAM